jgi:hypothetical protein
MTPRTPQCEVFWALLSSSEHSGIPDDSKSPTSRVLGFTPTLGQSGVATAWLDAYKLWLICRPSWGASHLRIGNFFVFWSRMLSFCVPHLSTLCSWMRVGLLDYPSLLFGMSFECSILCILDVRIKHLENFPLFVTNIVVNKKVYVPLWASFCTKSHGCFLFIVNGHLLMSCMALQTFRSMSIEVCTSRLAFTKCPLKKRQSSYIFHRLHFLFVKKSWFLLWFPFCKSLSLFGRNYGPPPLARKFVPFSAVAAVDVLPFPLVNVPMQ